jgi:DNA-binding LacI/PurR family transcriptional regulator
VVGCDDSPMAARTVPTLTSLRQPVRLLAERAVDMLAAKIRNPRFEAHALERPELIVRESTSSV